MSFLEPKINPKNIFFTILGHHEKKFHFTKKWGQGHARPGGKRVEPGWKVGTTIFWRVPPFLDFPES